MSASLTSSWTVEQLHALEKSISEGVYVVKYSDKMITYRSLDEMLRLREAMRLALGLTEKSVRLLARHSKGLC